MNDKLTEKLQKYEDLVSFARIQSKNAEFPLVKELIERVETNYPEEVENLRGADSDWYHGFNSGCLAILRYLGESNKQIAEAEFPMLDT